MCGIVGIYGTSETVAVDIYDALLMVQHRGQDAAGILTYNGHFHLHKDNGLVTDVITQPVMERLSGNIGIGHVRYRTAGNMDPTAAQPFIINSPYGIGLIHNGNLTNYDQLKRIITEEDNRYLNSTSDSEMMLNVMGHELQKDATRYLEPSKLFEVMERTFKRLSGSYAVITIIAGQGMVAFRDPYGIRPLILGQRKASNGEIEYMFASESVALTSCDFEIVGDVAAGEVVYIDRNRQVHRKVCAEKPVRKTCIFEYVYLARPDSIMDEISVYKARLRMGESIAQKVKDLNLEIDVVIPVPDTARTCAITLAHELDVKYREGLMKNRYVGRTFIMPEQGSRRKSIRQKLHPIELEIRNKNVMLVDDSIVRGNTSREIVEMVRDQGAKNVYFVSCAPPVRYQCVYGVDMPTKAEFIAHNRTEQEIADYIGADAVIYQENSDLIKSVIAPNKDPNQQFCAACFTGEYPTPEVTEDYLREVAAARGDHGDAQKIEF